MCPSIAYEYCQTPCICLKWMWKPFHVGLEPQPLHTSIISSPAVTRFSSKYPKSWPISVVVTAWWRIHLPIHSSYECCQTPCICLKWMWEPFHVGLEPQPLHNGNVCCPAVTQFSSRYPKSWPTSVVVMAWWHIHLSIHSIWMLPNTLNMFEVDVGTIPCGSRASTTAQQYC